MYPRSKLGAPGVGSVSEFEFWATAASRGRAGVLPCSTSESARPCETPGSELRSGSCSAREAASSAEGRDAMEGALLAEAAPSGTTASVMF
eukprot:scaffold5440_cov32-Tisochrysis_lutea.AAC.2